MRYRLLLQVGAYHKPTDNPDADFITLSSTPPRDLVLEAMNSLNFNFMVKEVHKLADGATHMIEFESIVDVDPERKETI